MPRDLCKGTHCQALKRKRYAYYAYTKTDIDRFCPNCATKGMINIYTRKCKTCKTGHATYREQEKEIPEYCRKCHSPDMIHCAYSPASYAECASCGAKKSRMAKIGGNDLYCQKCATPDMIDIYRSCEKCKQNYPQYGPRNGKKNTCVKCKESWMTSTDDDNTLELASRIESLKREITEIKKQKNILAMFLTEEYAN